MSDRETGLSLAEVVVALGLLLGVLLSTTGLFLQSAGVLRSGADATRALAVATTVLEETSGWGLRGLYATFGRDGLAASYRFDTRTESAASHWQAMLDRSLYRAWAEIGVEAVADAAGLTPPLATGRAVRLSVTVHWSERARRRSVSLQSVRM